MADREYRPEIHNLDSFDYKLSKEFKEYARYLRLSYLKEMRLIEDSEIPELEDLIRNNRNAGYVESARRALKRGDISEEEFFGVYNAYKKELMDAIIDANKQREVEQKEDIPDEEDLELPDIYYDYARFIKLSILQKQDLLSPEGLKELEYISENNEYAKTLLTAKKLLDNHKLSLDTYNAIKDRFSKELMEASRIVTEKKKKLNKIPETEEDNKKKEITEEDELNKLEQDILDYGNDKVVGDVPPAKTEPKFDPIKNDAVLNFIYDTFNGDKVDNTRDQSDDELNKVNKIDTENETSQLNKKGKEEDINELARFFNLRASRVKNGLLTMEENDEYDNIVRNNDRAFEIEKADLEYKYNKISKDEYNNIINKHKDYLIEAMSEYRLTKKVDNEKVETEVPVVKETPVQETPATDAPVEQDEPAKDDDDTLKIMRETIDHYMAYKKGLNRLGVADMHGLMELLAAKSNNGPEEGSKTYQK